MASAAIIGGALAGAGALGGGIIGAKSQEETNQMMMDMSNTQYQRAMADMEAAGLNPILAGDKGGAGTPQLTAPKSGQGLSNATRTLTMDYPQSQAQVSESETRQGINKEEEKKKRAETELTNLNKLVATANAKQMNELARRTGAEADQEEVKGRAARAAGGWLDEKSGKSGKSWSDALTPDKARDELKAKRYSRSMKSHQTPSQAYESGRGNVYGGTHSAKRQSSIIEHNPAATGGRK